ATHPPWIRAEITGKRPDGCDGRYYSPVWALGAPDLTPGGPTMSAVDFVRGRRRPGPPAPGGEVDLQPPPQVPRAVGGGMLLKRMPVVMAVAMIGMIALLISTGGLRNPMMLMFPMMMVMSMVGMLAGSGAGKDKRPAEFDEERKDYFRYLTETRAQVHTTAAEQRAALQWSHPDPAALAALVGSPRMWERGPGDEDFTHVRIGVGDQRLATRLVVPPLGPLEDLEPVDRKSTRLNSSHVSTSYAV